MVEARQGAGAPLFKPSVEMFWEESRGYAAGAAWSLQESWKRPVRHNRRLERLALWYTVKLDENCAMAVNPDARVFPLTATAFDPEARYEVTAALREIPRLVPFALGRDRLRQPIGYQLETWGKEMAVREPSLVDDWREWLWTSPRAPVDPEDHGDASVLAIACSRFAEVLPRALGRE